MFCQIDLCFNKSVKCCFHNNIKLMKYKNLNLPIKDRLKTRKAKFQVKSLLLQFADCEKITASAVDGVAVSKNLSISSFPFICEFSSHKNWGFQMLSKLSLNVSGIHFPNHFLVFELIWHFSSNTIYPKLNFWTCILLFKDFCPLPPSLQIRANDTTTVQVATVLGL